MGAVTRVTRLLVAPAALTVALLGLAGCGSDATATDPTDPTAPTAPTGGTGTSVPTTPSESAPASPTSSTATPADLPECDAVWVAGQKLPASYQGCLQDGSTIAPKKHPCETGSPIIEFDNRYYASAGRPINDIPDLAHSSQFRAALSACQA